MSEVRAGGAGAVAVGGNVRGPITTNVFYQGEARFTVEMPPAGPPDGTADLAGQPSKLLNARRQTVAFTGRGRELGDLAAWREQGPRRAARLIYAPGGRGKTRLAAQAAAIAAGEGWTVGWARHRTDTPLGGPPLATDDGAPLLIVVDYAERWPMSDLRALLAGQVPHPGRLRVLLLARSMGWWAAADAVCENLGILTGAPKYLDLRAEDRAEHFTAAARRFRDIYRLEAGIALPRGLDDRAYGSVLTVHMAALAAVDAYARGQAPPPDPADLSRYLLHREHLYWETPDGTDARAVFLAAVTGAVDRATGIDLLARTGLPAVTGTSAQRILDAHARCYPATTAGTVLEPLHPDRLAEDFIGLTAGADPWCADALTGPVFARTGGRVPAYAGRGLIVLSAAAAKWTEVAHALRTLLRADPALAVDAGGAALMAITPFADAAIAAAISRHLTGRGLDLEPAAAVLSCGILQVAAGRSPLG
ncbi:hypothetical protein [Paractinoplanes rishiriensis]|uniref:Uncharacterized protein n=1 Tax=Paractinoplanes rishiriensis TaxID=1050105 RepID=A0A919K2G2_9ACTN|nr:hypothetical protein [Actinoplanes rishiriensis]GIE97647.1 hypothetical protein Ari01nite_51120 [Actinoplanes rishiriensis]